MSILIDKNTKVVVQGITGREGSYHARLMSEYGTNVVAGSSPGKGGEAVFGIPVYNTVLEAVEEKGADTSVIFVPPKFAIDAIYEGAEAGIKLIVCITEGIPSHDIMYALKRIEIFYPDTKIIGPNCPGIISPGDSLVGIMPGNVFMSGGVGIMSRSGTLTYQIAYDLTRKNIGQSTVIGVGGDPFIGLNFTDIVKMFNADYRTKAICIIGEIGGSDEEDVSEYIKDNVEKPVVAYVAGQTAPSGKKMGHAGAIVSSSRGTADSKLSAFREAGVGLVEVPYGVSGYISKFL